MKYCPEDTERLTGEDNLSNYDCEKILFCNGVNGVANREITIQIFTGSQSAY